MENVIIRIFFIHFKNEKFVGDNFEFVIVPNSLFWEFSGCEFRDRT